MNWGGSFTSRNSEKRSVNIYLHNISQRMDYGDDFADDDGDYDGEQPETNSPAQTPPPTQQPTTTSTTANTGSINISSLENRLVRLENSLSAANTKNAADSNQIGAPSKKLSVVLKRAR